MHFCIYHISCFGLPRTLQSVHAHGEGQHGNIEPYHLLSGLEVTRIQGVFFATLHPTGIQYATANSPIYSAKVTKLKNAPGLAKQAIHEEMR